MKHFLLYLICFGVSFVANAKVNLVLSDAESKVEKRWTFDAEKDLFKFLQQYQNQQIEEGYLLASIDAFKKLDDTTYAAQLYLGKTYKWAHINLQGINPLLLSKLNIVAAHYESAKVSPPKIKKLIDQLLVYYENNGYPFATARISLDSVTAHDLIFASLEAIPNQQILIDTLIVKGDVNINNDFLQQYLGLKVGDPYNEQVVKQISKKIKELTFLEETAPHEVHFSIEGTKVYLYLKTRRSNQINGLLGLQQDATSIDPKYMVTADLLLKLKNAFGRGELLDVKFQNLQKQSPRFNLSANYPYILNTKFAVDAAFEIYKKDTAYVNVQASAGVRYLLNSRDYIGLSYTLQSSRIVSPNLSFIQSVKRLPKEIDYKTNGIQLSLHLDRTNYVQNPSKGFYTTVNSTIGLRSVKPNNAITSIQDGSGFDYSALYDTLSAKVYQYKLGGTIGYFQPLWKQIVLHIAYSGGYVSGSNVFMNELYQIGGYAILRGYDEQSIFVNQYHIVATELRLLFEENAYAYLFTDNGWYQTRYDVIDNKYKPFSLGLGLHLDNKTGAFKIAIGVGKPQGEAIQFKNAKLHFGYVAYF